MRAAIEVAFLGGLVALAGALVTFAQTHEALVLRPYADMHAMQAETGLDLGFLPGERHPGIGGSGQDVDLTLSFPGITLDCVGGAYEISALAGLLEAGRVFCPFGNATEATEATQAVMAKMATADGWALTEDVLQSPRRAPEVGRTTAEAFDYLMGSDRTERISRVWLQVWQRQDGGRIAISAAMYRKHGDGRPHYEIEFSFDRTCLFQLGVFTTVAPGDESWPDPDLDEVKAHFGGRAFGDLPPDERYAAAADYAAKVCLSED